MLGGIKPPLNGGICVHLYSTLDNFAERIFVVGGDKWRRWEKLRQVVACFGGALCLSRALFLYDICFVVGLITYSWSFAFEPSLAPFASTIFSVG